MRHGTRDTWERCGALGIPWRHIGTRWALRLRLISKGGGGMNPAITTRYIGPTNYRGSRIKAIAHGSKRSITVSWQDELNVRENHTYAAKKLAELIHERPLNWVGCESLDTRGYTFVGLPAGTNHTTLIEAVTGMADKA